VISNEGGQIEKFYVTNEQRKNYDLLRYKGTETRTPDFCICESFSGFRLITSIRYCTVTSFGIREA
jgi:hypothetical protein